MPARYRSKFERAIALGGSRTRGLPRQPPPQPPISTQSKAPAVSQMLIYPSKKYVHKLIHSLERMSVIPDATTVVENGEPFPKGNSSSTQTEKKNLGKKINYLSIFKYADKYDIILLVSGTVAALLAGACLPLFSEIFGRMISKMVENPWDIVKDMNKMALLMTIIGVISFVLSVIYMMCWLVAAQRQVSCIKAKFLYSVMRQDMSWHDKHKPGELLSRMDGDTKVIENGINDKIGSGISLLFTFFFGYVLGFYRCWQLAFVILGSVPFYILLGFLLSKALASFASKGREGYAKAGEMATEALDNIRTVQIFCAEAYELQRFSDAIAPSRKSGVKKEFVANITVGIMTSIGWAVFGLAFWFSSYLLQWGNTTVASITTTFFACMIGSMSIGLFFPTLGTFSEAIGAAETVYTIIDRVPEIDINERGKIPQDQEFHKNIIQFEHVKFSYPTRKEDKLFFDLNVAIEKGTTVAFSGASGSGKSSIIQMIQRFYDPDEGTISVGRINLKNIDLGWWRDQIGVVSQEPNLFSGSIRDNILVGKQDASQEEIEDACKAANIHELIMCLPQQYDSKVGAVGSQLSGGQKQRIAIARAIVKKPQILILDEATSALDRKSEQEVQAALDSIIYNASGDRLTVFVIAHRLTTIRNADCIHFIQHDDAQGSLITESGMFDELMELNGQFAAMAKTQKVYIEQEEGSPSNALLESEEAASGKHFYEKSLTLHDSMILSLASPQYTLEEIAQQEIEQQTVPACHLWFLNTGYYWAIFIGSFGSFLIGSVLPIAPVVLSFMLETLGKNAKQPEKLREEVPFWAGMFLILATASLCGWSCHGFYGVSGERLTMLLRCKLLKAMLHQDQIFFDTPGRDAGALTGILAGDTEKIHLLCGNDLGCVVQFIVSFFAGLVIAFVFQWKVALIVTACAPLTLACGASQSFFNRRRFGLKGKKEVVSEDTCKAEIMGNIRTVAAFNLQERKIEEYSCLVKDQELQEMQKSIFLAAMYGTMQFTFFGITSLAFWYGSPMIRNGSATFKDVMIAAMSTTMGSISAGRAMGVLASVNDTLYCAKVVFSIIDRVPIIDAECDEGITDIGEGCFVELTNVKFRYPARPLMPVLKHLNLTFSDGSSNGFIGQTGCGKSTSVQLLSRYYDPNSGHVLINGKDLRSINLRTWRQHISLVMQEPALCSGTVRDNIRYGKQNASNEEIEDAAKIACIHDDILSWPLGYDTEVGYRGRMLSGGQKQRVAIARAFLRNAKLLLMDEATSALDNATESKVQMNIEHACRKRKITSVAVAHRLTTIRNCDQIVLLDEGRIIEQGSHEELVALDGEYKVRWNLYQNSIQ